MKIVTSKELAKIPNGSLILEVDKETLSINEKSLMIFMGNIGYIWCDEELKNDFWNGICYLNPDCYNKHFTKDDIDNKNDFLLSEDDVLFYVDTDSNDYEEDDLFAVYNEDEKKAFVRQLLGFLGYKLKDIKEILEED